MIEASLQNPQISLSNNAAINQPAIMSQTMTKNKSFSNGTSSIDQTKLLMKMFNEKGQSTNRSDLNSVERSQV